MKISNDLHRGQLREKASWIIACLFLAIVITMNAIYFLQVKDELHDFGSFYASGLKSKNGENPYGSDSDYIFDVVFPRIAAGGKMVNLNPPISVILFEFMSQFNPYRSLALWRTVSFLFYVASIFLLILSYKEYITPIRLIWPFALAGFWHTLLLGQIYTLLLVFTVLGWIFLQRGKHILAGIAIGLVIAIKPNFIIWPIFLLISGYYVTVLTSIISSLLISLVPIIIYGSTIYVQWLEASALRHATLIMPGNNSILGLTARFQGINLGIVFSIALVSILLIVSKWKISNQITPAEYISALGILASLLASPISWTGYTILLLPIFFSLKKWSIPVTISVVILSIPFIVVLLLHQASFASFVIFGWLYGWGILLLLGNVVRNAMITSSIQTS